jgi:hypothetical protein
LRFVCWQNQHHMDNADVDADTSSGSWDPLDHGCIGLWARGCLSTIKGTLKKQGCSWWTGKIFQMTWLFHSLYPSLDGFLPIPKMPSMCLSYYPNPK